MNAAHTGVTDEGAAWLLRGTNLVSLDLRYTNITDATLRLLEIEETLRWLNVAGYNVSALALRCLSEALPDCELYV